MTIENPKLVPVFDILGGHVVHAIAGRRSEYRPIVSRWGNPSQPFELITEVISTYLPEQIYLADLNAIIHANFSWDFYAKLTRLPCPVWLDAGITDPIEILRLLDVGLNLVLGLESLHAPIDLEKIVTATRHDLSRLRFSLDLQKGIPKASPNWSSNPLNIVEQVHSLGLKQLIVLDLAAVGLSNGTQTEDLCKRLKKRYSDLDLWVGGGIRSWNDLDQLAESGITGALVATALHDGRIMPR